MTKKDVMKNSKNYNKTLYLLNKFRDMRGQCTILTQKEKAYGGYELDKAKLGLQCTQFEYQVQKCLKAFCLYCHCIMTPFSFGPNFLPLHM